LPEGLRLRESQWEMGFMTLGGQTEERGKGIKNKLSMGGMNNKSEEIRSPTKKLNEREKMPTSKKYEKCALYGREGGEKDVISSGGDLQNVKGGRA